jgi:hypothetical protein
MELMSGTVYNKGKNSNMKVTLEFDGEEEQEEIQLALDGYKWKNAMWELDQELRKTTKHQVSIISFNDNASEQEMEIAEAVRRTIRKILDDYNLNLEL